MLLIILLSSCSGPGFRSTSAHSGLALRADNVLGPEVGDLPTPTERTAEQRAVDRLLLATGFAAAYFLVYTSHEGLFSRRRECCSLSLFN